MSAIFSKIWGWLIGLAVVGAGILAIFLKGRESGKASNQAKVDEATQDAQIATHTAQAVETRHDIDQTVAQLPEAPAQTVANADPNSALGQLRDDGWVR
jgi:hypothetical protein